jgi:hypothetical protein
LAQPGWLHLRLLHKFTAPSQRHAEERFFFSFFVEKGLGHDLSSYVPIPVPVPGTGN